MDFNTQDMKKVAQIAQKMKGKSEDQAIKEIVQMIKSGQGGMSPQKIEQMIALFMPMLDADQRSKLEKLRQELKDE